MSGVRSGAKTMPQGAILQDRYQVQSVLGEDLGAMVYAVKDLRDHQSLVLWRFYPHPGRTLDGTQVERLIAAMDPGSDGRIARALQHVARVLDYGDDYVVTEQIVGDDLVSYLRRNGGDLSDERARHLYGQLGAALIAAHERGVCHGALNPSRIFVCNHRNDAAFIRIAGLGLYGLGGGLADVPEDPRAVAYLAPEQASQLLRGETVQASAEADQFALAALISELLIGRPIYYWPGRDGSRDVLEHLSRYDPEIFALGPARERTLQRALHRAPDQRFSNVADFVRELSGDTSGEANETRLIVKPENAPAVAPAKQKDPTETTPIRLFALNLPKRPVVVGLAAGGTLALALLVSWVVGSGGGSGTPKGEGASLSAVSPSQNGQKRASSAKQPFASAAPGKESIPEEVAPAPAPSPVAALPSAAPAPAVAPAPVPVPAVAPVLRPLNLQVRSSLRLRPSVETALLGCSRQHLKGPRSYPVVFMNLGGIPALDPVDTAPSVRRNGRFLDCLKQNASGLPQNAKITIEAK